MLTSIDARADLSPAPIRSVRLGGTCLALGGIVFFAGGVTHPGDSGGGTKVEQLYDMFVERMWYSSHALLVASFALFASAVLLLRKQGGLGRRRRADVGAPDFHPALGTAVALGLTDVGGVIGDAQPAQGAEEATERYCGTQSCAEVAPGRCRSAARPSGPGRQQELTVFLYQRTSPALKRHLAARQESSATLR